jgi:hypothetical protein
MACVRVTSLSPLKKSLSETGVRWHAGIISDMMLGRQSARILGVLRVQSFNHNESTTSSVQHWRAGRAR